MGGRRTWRVVSVLSVVVLGVGLARGVEAQAEGDAARSDAEARPPAEAAPATDGTLGVVSAIVGGLALASTAFAVGAGIVTLDHGNALDAACNVDVCPPVIDGTPIRAYLDEAHGWATLANVFGLVGAGLGAVAIVLAVLSAEHGRQRGSPPIGVILSERGFTLTWTGRL